MGKSPAKWIKTVLFGKKSYKSNTSKGREKLSNEKEFLVSVKASEANAALNPALDSHPTLKYSHIDERELLLENKEAADISGDGGISLPGSQVTDSQNLSLQDTPYNPEKVRQDKAATQAQAAFRGYLALICGHLVRRQAVATLGAMLGIIKLQAIVRSGKVRHSDIGLEVLQKWNSVELSGKPVNSVQRNLSTRMTKLSSNAFISKLLASPPAVMPLYLQYDSGETNSVSNWLERWSASCFWKPTPQPKEVSESKSQKKLANSQTLEAETGQPKRSFHRIPAANPENILVQSNPEFEKCKRNLKKVSSPPADPVHENSQIELEKVKRSLRKVHNPAVENSVSVQSEMEIEKPKHILEKIPSNPIAHEVLEWSTSNLGEKMKKETILASFKQPDVETAPEPMKMNEAWDLLPVDQAADESKRLMETSGKYETIPITNGEFNVKEESTNNENHKSDRKASAMAKQECAEDGLPSYMAATESAKAKLRLQGSPRSGQDGAEKNSATRLHSLPSLTNGKISSQSPRTKRHVHACNKGSNKGDKSHLSSRDGNAKVNQVEWRR